MCTDNQMNLLQIPIIDEYWVPPRDPASHNRTTDFAISMGFGTSVFYRPNRTDSQATVSLQQRLAQKLLLELLCLFILSSSHLLRLRVTIIVCTVSACKYPSTRVSFEPRGRTG